MKFTERILRYLPVLLMALLAALSMYLTTLSREGSLGGAMTSIATYATAFEDRFYDFRMNQSRNRVQRDDRIVLAKIDDESLEKIGRWPWTRTVISRLISKLHSFGAQTVTFDIMFSEPEKSCAGSPDSDLAKSISQFQTTPGNRIILAYGLAGSGDPVATEIPGDLYNFVVDSEVRSGQSTGVLLAQINRTTFPIASLLQASPSLGFLNTFPDDDGVFRHFPIIANIDNIYFPSLALATYEAYTKDKTKITIDSYGNASFNTHSGSFKLNRNGETKIRYFGDANQFGQVSVWSLLNTPDDDSKMRSLLQGKMVFVASTAMGAHDLRNTSLDAQMPGVYLHINLVHMLMSGYFFQDFDSSVLYSFVFLIIGLILLIGIQIRGHAILDLVVLMVLVVGSYLIDLFVLMPRGFEIRLFFCYLTLIFTYSWTTFISFYKTSREKKQIRGAFSRYVAPAIVDQMLSNPDKLTLGGERKDITCIFSDVRDFTSISEKLTATQLSTALNQYMTVMTNILFDSMGTLDKYIGDAIVGYWGAPVADEHHAYHAIQGATRMIEALPAINENFKANGLPEFKFGIGLNSGECSVGNMGSDKIFSYTALGDNMNLGSRLEGLTKFYGVQLIISEFTFGKLSDEQKKEFKFRKLDMVRVKGKEKAVTIYEVLHPSHPLQHADDVLAAFDKAFALYTAQKFKEAIAILDPEIARYPGDHPLQLLKDNCEHYIAEPPAANWDGATTYKSK